MSDKIENIIGYNSIEFVTNQIVEGFITGLHKSPFHGFSVEFAEHRLYNSGESIKNIDWKLFGRTDKFFVKKYEEETNLRCVLVLDHSSSMFFPIQKESSFSNPNKITFAAYASGVIIQMLSRQRDAFGLSLVSEKIDLITDIRSNFGHKKYVFNLLEDLIRQKDKEIKVQTNISPILHQLAEQIHRRSLVIIFTDLLSSQEDEKEIISSLQHLKHCKHEVILFHVNDKNKEIDFDYKNHPYRLIDIETSEEIKLNPQDLREVYQKAILNKIKTIKDSCENIRIDFVDANINEGLDKILLPYIIKRTKMN
ncbi:MAG: DUF58 domain-containing protein [Bacteroidales bacterium]|nr:DUF58 domain-containing protein [Bacteroidales bacterium]